MVLLCALMAQSGRYVGQAIYHCNCIDFRSVYFSTYTHRSCSPINILYRRVILDTFARRTQYMKHHETACHINHRHCNEGIVQKTDKIIINYVQW